MDKINVDGYSNLKRDLNSGAILNVDNSEYENYLKLKHEKEIEKIKLDTAINEISMLKCELSEIKSILLNLGNHYGSI